MINLVFSSYRMAPSTQAPVVFPLSSGVSWMYQGGQIRIMSPEAHFFPDSRVLLLSLLLCIRRWNRGGFWEGRGGGWRWRDWVRRLDTIHGREATTFDSVLFLSTGTGLFETARLVVAWLRSVCFRRLFFRLFFLPLLFSFLLRTWVYLLFFFFAKTIMFLYDGDGRRLCCVCYVVDFVRFMIDWSGYIPVPFNFCLCNRLSSLPTATWCI